MNTDRKPSLIAKHSQTTLALGDIVQIHKQLPHECGEPLHGEQGRILYSTADQVTIIIVTFGPDYNMTTFTMNLCPDGPWLPIRREDGVLYLSYQV